LPPFGGIAPLSMLVAEIFYREDLMVGKGCIASQVAISLFPFALYIMVLLTSLALFAVDVSTISFDMG
jgi:hypothetical protein